MITLHLFWYLVDCRWVYCTYTLYSLHSCLYGEFTDRPCVDDCPISFWSFLLPGRLLYDFIIL